METFKIKFTELQVSQLYLDRSQLEAATREFSPGSMEPIPVVRLGDRTVITDGHTRAVAALVNGLTEIPTVWDEDELDLDAYSTCVDWCHEQGIYSLDDLQYRLLPSDQYQVLWVDRCRKMLHELEHARGHCGCESA